MDRVERCFIVAAATSLVVLIAATTWFGFLTF
jgi:hypothetical protein